MPQSTPQTAPQSTPQAPQQSTQQGPQQSTMSPARMEAFSDGVMAIIITIMVLELKVPARDGLSGLWIVLPTLAVYLLSFLQTGIYWINHHYLMDDVSNVSHSILWSNLMLLFTLSLIPFATAWVEAKGLSSADTAIYATICLLPALSFALLWAAIRSSNPVSKAVGGWKKLFGSAALYLVAIPAAFWHPAASLLMVAGVAVVWMLPPRSVQRKKSTAAAAAKAKPPQPPPPPQRPQAPPE